MNDPARQRKLAHKKRKAKGKAVSKAQHVVFLKSLATWKRDRPMPAMALAPVAAALMLGRR